MPAFKDTAGREWLVTISVAEVRRVRRTLSVNLADLQAGKLLEQLSDPVTLVDVLYVLIEPQAFLRNLTDEQFGQAMGGDVLTAAATALLEALCDFFPGASRELLRKILAATTQRQLEIEQLIRTDGDRIVAEALGKEKSGVRRQEIGGGKKSRIGT